MIEKDKKTVKDSNRMQTDTVKKGYARYKRSELLTILKPVLGKLELDEINKASERFQGLSDAAEKSADRATKTPHVDEIIIAQDKKN